MASLGDLANTHIFRTNVTWNNSNSADVDIAGMTSDSYAIVTVNSASSATITDATPFAGGLRIRLNVSHNATHPVTIIWK